MPDLDKLTITEVVKREPLRLVARNVEADDLPFADEPIDEDPTTILKLNEVKFVLESVIAFLEELKLSGEPLRQAGQLLRDVEALQLSL